MYYSCLDNWDILRIEKVMNNKDDLLLVIDDLLTTERYNAYTNGYDEGYNEGYDQAQLDEESY